MRMRLFAVAFLAALSLGAAQPPEPPAQAQQRQANGDLKASASRIVDAIHDIAPEKDAGCEDRKDKRGSDLCAQWKAADAARDAADYTLIAIALSFLGTVLIALTFWETRKTARQELRAYVLLKATDLDPIDRDGSSHIHVCLTNTGVTPAFDLTFWGVTSVKPWPSEGAPRVKPDWVRVSSETLATGRDSTLVLPVGPINQQMRGRLNVGTAAIYFFGEAKYKDAFGQQHATHIHLVCEGEGFHRRRFHACEDGNSAT